MTKKDAYNLGYESGYESGQYGDYTAEELEDEDSFLAALSEILENKRQYADSPTYDFEGERNADSLFDSFDEGETDGGLAWYRETYGK